MLTPVAPSRALYFSTWAMAAYVYTHRKQQWFWDIFGLGALLLPIVYFLSMKHVCDAGIADLKHQHSYAVATCCSNSYKIVLYRDNSIHIVDIVVHRAVTTTISWVLIAMNLYLRSEADVKIRGQELRHGVTVLWGKRFEASSSNRHSLTSRTVSCAKIWQSNKRCQKNQLLEFGDQKPMEYFCEHDWRHSGGFMAEI